MAIQMSSRHHVSLGKNAIIVRQHKAPSAGTNGTSGQRNFRGRSGLV